MIGIYKITNKLNGKSYVGQSIDIKRRWREHINNSSNSLIHKAIIKYGEDNFIFEILEECKRDYLNEKEIFYIKNLNTLYPNGYNLTPGGQFQNSTQLLFDKIKNLYKKYETLTTRSWLIYYFLLSIAWKEQDHYYVYKNQFKIKDACETLNISQPTWRSAIKKLKEEFIIKEKDKYFEISFPTTYAPLDIELIKFLIPFGAELCKRNGGNIISVYSIIYRYWLSCQENNEVCEITINQLKTIFTSRRTKEDTIIYRLMLGLFDSYGLIDMIPVTRENNGIKYTAYLIKSVSLTVDYDLDLDFNAPESAEDILEKIETKYVEDIEIID